MKTRNLLFAALMLAFGVASCENVVETPVTPDEDAKICTVHFNLGGELNISQNPLTRITLDDRDLIGIDVYNVTENSSYAYGLFDNIEDAKIDLIADDKYRFRVLLIDDGKDKIYRDSVVINEKVYYGYKKPFLVDHMIDGCDVEILDANNTFTITTKDFFNFGDSTEFTLQDNKHYKNPTDIDVYYGKIEFTPTADNESIDIVMKHMIYGLRIEVGDFFNEGVITLRLNNDSNNVYFELTPENNVIEQSYANVSSRWESETDLSKTSIYYYISDIVWTKNDGTKVEWKSQQVRFNRLKETVIKIEMYEIPDNSRDVKITFEDLPMEYGYSNYVIGDEWEELYW